MARSAYEHALEFAQTRMSFGKAIIEHQSQARWPKKYAPMPFKFTEVMAIYKTTQSSALHVMFAYAKFTKALPKFSDW